MKIEAKSDFQVRCLTIRADMMLLGGAAGASKTTITLLDALRHRNTDAKMLFIRRYSKDIMQPGGLWDEACKFFLPVGAKTNILKRRFTFKKGATISFLHADRLEDVEKSYRGGQIDVLYIDEVTELDEDVFWFLQSRNRSTNSCGIKPYTMMTCNPEENWVKKLITPYLDEEGFPDKTMSNKKTFLYKKGDVCNTYTNHQELVDNGISEKECYSFIFMPGTLKDNPVLIERDPDYLKRLNTLPEFRRRSMTEGCWNFPKNQSLFKASSFQRFELSEMPQRFDNVIVCADLAIKLHAKADFTVFGVYGMIKKQIYLIYMIKGKWSFEFQKDQLQYICKQFTQIQKVYVENAGHADAFFQSLNQDLGIKMVLVSRGPDQGKYSRACATLPAVESGLVWVPLTEFGDNFIKEMVSFTGMKTYGSRHDDMCDTFFDACRFLKPEDENIRDSHFRRNDKVTTSLNLLRRY